MEVSDATCAVCNKPGRYKLPKKEIPYCSVECFRQLAVTEKTPASLQSSNKESTFFSSSHKNFETTAVETDEERKRQFLQLARSNCMQEFLQDRLFCQQLQEIAESPNPLEKLVLVRSQRKFTQFEQAVFAFFNVADDQV